MNKSGFTLIEAMIAAVFVSIFGLFAIIGLFATMMIPDLASGSQDVSVGINGVVTTRCINGYEFVVGSNGSARQVMDELGHGVRCGR